MTGAPVARRTGKGGGVRGSDTAGHRPPRGAGPGSGAFSQGQREATWRGMARFGVPVLPLAVQGPRMEGGGSRRPDSTGAAALWVRARRERISGEKYLLLGDPAFLQPHGDSISLLERRRC